MPRGERVDIEKSEEIIIFIDFVCRYVASDYLTENTIIHRFIIPIVEMVQWAI